MNPADALARTGLLLAPDTRARLAALRVTVAGLGAVGACLTEFLARLGVGRLTLVDFDRLTPNSLNRHPGATLSTLDRPKAEVMAERVTGLGLGTAVEVVPRFIHADTLEEILARPTDVLADAIDSLLPKVLLLHAAADRVPVLISAMGAGGRLDPTRVRLGDLSETVNCPLARAVRRRLARLGRRGGIRVVFSDEPPAPPGTEAEPGGLERGRRRRPVGTVSYLPAVFAAAMAWDILNRLSTADRPLSPADQPAPGGVDPAG